MCFFILSDLEQPLWTNGKHKFALPEQNRLPEIMTKTTPYEFAKAQSALIQLKGDSEYAAGDHFTMADILLTQTLNWAQKFEFDVADSLIDYKDTLSQRAAFVRARQKIGK